MTGIEDRVKLFLEIWQMREAGEIPDREEARCVVCGTILEDGNFIRLDSD
jgi:hypothetical protein